MRRDSNTEEVEDLYIVRQNAILNESRCRHSIRLNQVRFKLIHLSRLYPLEAQGFDPDSSIVALLSLA